MLPGDQDRGTVNLTKLLRQLVSIVGRRHVLTGTGAMRWYRTGYRFGFGSSVAVVRPGTLVELWRALKVCVEADVIVIMQAANTGVTGGSTPHGDDYDRPVVIISTTRLSGVHLIDEGRQVICLAGATLMALERVLLPIGREPHSVIGSTCIGASVIGGVCNNSGGALVTRGPAFTEMSLFARVSPSRELHLINHLGVRLGTDPEQMLEKLESRGYTASEVECHPDKALCDRDYSRRVRDIDADTPARFNADGRRLFEASGSAGKVVVFAIRLATFERETRTTVFYIGTNAPVVLTQLRRDMLGRPAQLPVAAEYMHRTAFDIAAKYGKDTFLAIQHLGASRLPGLFRLKGRIDALSARSGIFGGSLGEHLLQFVSECFPQHLPRRLLEYRDRYEHHLLLKMAGDGIAEARAYLSSVFPAEHADFFECTAEEGTKAFMHRFAAAAAAVRYRAVHSRTVEDIVALDVALRRNDRNWFETLPADMDECILHRLYYGHFFCHVFHQDYIVAKGHAPHALEQRLWALLDRRGAEYPAEHNVGHLYEAKPALRAFYRSLDPCNQLNAGIGRTSKLRNWQSCDAAFAGTTDVRR